MTDIVERLRFDAARCELQFSKGVAGNIEEAAAEIERLMAALTDLRERAAEEGIHHFVNRIDAALKPKPNLRTLLPELAVIAQVVKEPKS